MVKKKLSKIEKSSKRRIHYKKKVNSNSFNWNNLIYLIIILVLIGAILYLVITKSYLFGDLSLNGINTDPFGGCELNIEKNIACVGEEIEGILRDGAYSECIIAVSYDDAGWKLFGNAKTDSKGEFYTNQSLPSAGTYVFAALCSNGTFFCRTNDEVVEIINCNDNQDSTAYTCGWVGEQCGGTCPSSHPLCVDMWMDDTALLWDNGYAFCACINPDTEELHPDWKPDGQYHDDSGFPGDDNENDGEDSEDGLPEYPSNQDCKDWCINSEGYDSGAGLYNYDGGCFGDYETKFEKCCCWDIPSFPSPPEDCNWKCVRAGYEEGYGYSGSCGSGEEVLNNECCCKNVPSCETECASNPGGDFQAIIPFMGDSSVCSTYSQLFCKHYGWRTAGSGYSQSTDCCCFACY